MTVIPAVCLSLDFLMGICGSSGGDQRMLKMDHSSRKLVAVDDFFNMVKSPNGSVLKECLQKNICI